VQAALVTTVWDGASGNWDDTTDWSIHPLFPNDGRGTTYDATVNSGSVTLDGNFIVTNFTLTGGTVNGNGTLSVSGTLNFNGGSFGDGTATGMVSGPLAINLTSAGQGFIQQHFTLVNNGAGSWTGTGNLYNGGTLSNSGNLAIQSDQIIYNYGATGTFTNTGTLTKSVTTGTTTINNIFNNAGGTVNVQSGIISLAGGGSGTANATFGGSGSGVLSFDSGTFNMAGGTSFVGTGLTRVTGGTMNINGAVSATNFTLSGGTVTGNGTLSISGAFNFNGGYFGDGTATGTGTTTGPLAINLTGAGQGIIQTGYTVGNNGTGSWTGTGNLYNGGTFSNSGHFAIQNDLIIYNYGVTGTVNNTGTITKTVTTGTTTIYNIFNNAGGTVNVQSGIISLAGGGSGTANATFGGSGSGVLSFDSGTFNMAGGTSFVGTGLTRVTGGTMNINGAVSATNFTLTGGTVTGNGTLSVSGALNFNGGYFGDTVATGTTSGALSLNLTGAQGLISQNYTLSNNGSGSWTGTGTFYNGGTLSNSGTFAIQNDSAINNTGPAGTVSNSGTITKTIATGTTTIFSAFNNSNTGTLDVQSGTISLAGGGTNSGILQATNAGTLNLGAQTYTNTGGSIIANGGTVNLQGATVSGGTLLIVGAGTINPQTGSAFAGAATISGGQLSIQNGNNLYLEGPGTITLGGTVSGISLLCNGNNYTDLVLSGPGASVTLAGGGSVTGSDQPYNRIYAASAGMTLVNQATISGSISLNTASNAYTFNNQGTVTANQSNPLLLSTGTGVINTGTLQATGIGTLNLGSETFTNTGGNIIANGGTVNLQSGANIVGGALQISGGGTINAQSGSQLTGPVTITGGKIGVADNNNLSLVGDGTYTFNGAGTGISLNSGGANYSQILLTGTNGTVTLTGSGGISGSNSIYNRIYANSSGMTLVNSSGTTISGSIDIFTNYGFTLNNAGTVNANQTLPLNLHPGLGVQNTGILEATAGGTLNILSGGDVTNTGAGTIIANSGVVNLNNANVTGGTLQIIGTGSINSVSNPQLNGPISITGGKVGVADGNNLYLAGEGTYTFNGTGAGISLNSSGAGYSQILLTGTNGTVTLAGSGGISGSNSSINRIYAASSGMTLVNSSGTTISGAIDIFANYQFALNNAGTVNANQTAAMNLHPGLGVQNSGTLEATAGGTLNILSGGDVTNTGAGTIIANNGTVNFSNANVNNGSLQTLNGGIMQTGSGGALGISGTVTVTNNSTLGISNNTTLVLGNANLIVNGTVSMNAGANITAVQLAYTNGTVTIGGTGSLTTTDTAGLNVMYAVTTGTTLQNNGTVSGSLNMYQNYAWALNNAGTITGNQTNPLIIHTGGGTTNSGTIQASSGGTVILENDNFTNTTAGLILADTGSHINIASATISGGTLQSKGSGFIQTTDGGSHFNSLTIAGGSNVNLPTNTALTLNGGAVITNNGSVNQNAAGNYTDIILSGTNGTITVSGTGQWTSSDTAGLNRWYPVSTGITLVNDVNSTITGSQQFVVNYAWTFINNGTLIASNTNQMLVNPGTSFTNNGTLQANNGGTLTVAGTFTNNVAGVLTGGTYISLASGNGATVTIPGSAITQIAANTVVELSGAGSVFQAGTTSLESSLTTNNGTLMVLSNRSYSTANAFANGATPADTAVLQLGGGTFNAASLTNQAGSTIKGFGNITPRPTNHGLIEARGGTLSFASGILGGSGTVQIDAGSTLNLSAGTNGSNADYLIHNGTTAGSLNLGANSFTVAVDYNNANFGTGNSFNNHANVTASTGQILAANPAALTITGSLAFGNVHVGDTPSLSYTVNNVMTPGSSPQVRTALQTSVNGGNITDARLAGAGVTASDLAPIVAGASSPSLGVTFTAGSAGALTGQQTHIASNFDNVAGVNVAISGAAYRYANPTAHTPEPVAFGNVHVGDTPSQALTITNNVPADGFSEKLDASIGGATAGVTTNSGSFSLLAPQATNNSSLAVGLDTTSAGAKSGTATITLTSDGSGTSGLGTTGLGTQTVNVTGTVYRLAAASAHTPEPINFGNFHVGDTAPSQLLSITNSAANDGFSEKLDASIGGATAGVTTNSGAFSLLAPQATNSSNLAVGLDTTSAGAKSGTATITLTSDGSGTSGLGTTGLGTQTVNVTGTVYRLASASAPAPVNFGIVHVGDTPTQTISITNSAANDGFSEKLDASIGTPTGGVITNSGSFTQLNPQATNSTSLSVGVNTATAGSISGTASISLTSNGTGTSGLAPTVLAAQTVNVQAQVNYLADPRFTLTPGSGTLVQNNATTFTLSFGTVAQNTGTISLSLGVLNFLHDATYQDTLGGTFSTGGVTHFQISGFNSFSGTASGGSISTSIGFDSSMAAGSYSDSLILDPVSSNASGSMDEAAILLNIQGQIVPEPGSVLLLFIGISGICTVRRRKGVA
jgi:hypothetical protein